MWGGILDGPPASGKETVTSALHILDHRYQLFPRLKLRLRAHDRVPHNRRSPARRDPREGRRHLRERTIRRDLPHRSLTPDDHEPRRPDPVVHLGQPAGVYAVAAVQGFRWTIAALRCPRDLAAEELTGRGAGDVPERLTAHDATPPLTDLRPCDRHKRSTTARGGCPHPQHLRPQRVNQLAWQTVSSIAGV